MKSITLIVATALVWLSYAWCVNSLLTTHHVDTPLCNHNGCRQMQNRQTLMEMHNHHVDEDDSIHFAEERRPTNIRNHNKKSLSNTIISRRASLAAFVATTSSLASILSAYATDASSLDQQYTTATIQQAQQQSDNIRPSISIPLHYEPSLSAYTISYTVGNSKFGAIIDTGSPFLVVPQTSCRPDYPWGCFRPNESRPATGLKPTRERFDGNEGWVEWREGEFSFNELMITTSASLAATSSLALLFPQSSSMTFGVISESLMDGPGGVFLGLVKDTDSWIRPSFLGQSNVSAFSVDLRQREGTSKSLTLYGAGDGNNQRDLPNSDYAISMVRDLNKRYGDPTIHYSAIASSITVNGSKLASTSRRNKVYVIFDTGCSGMAICPDLFDEQYTLARSQKAKSVWGDVSIELDTKSGEKVELNARRPITTPLGSDRPWGKKLDGHLIVLGLAFLEGMKMTVDIDRKNVWFEE
jgi:hypothetical protein